MLYVGLDVHWKKSSLCILNDQGRQIKAQQVNGGWNRLLESLAKIQEPFSLCFEASVGYGYLHQHIGQLPNAQRVVVGHPGQMRLIFKAKRKNDRVDAGKIAKLLFLDAVPQVHVPSLDVRSWRGLIEWRASLLHKRVATKNQIRALLKNAGIQATKGLWTKKGLHWLSQQQFPTTLETVRRDMLLEELADHNRRIKQVESALNQEAKKHPGVALLRTIPGVGPRTAEALVAYIDQPQRFGSIRDIGPYLGLVPCQDASADKNRLGHITKDGPRTVRKLLTEAAWQGVNRCSAIRKHYERIVGDDPDKRKIALIATARWLATIALAMLKSGEVCRFKRDLKLKRCAKGKAPVFSPPVGEPLQAAGPLPTAG
ncbi:MAG: IS110 family transposase [Phycisphaerae bacterium]